MHYLEKRQAQLSGTARSCLRRPAFTSPLSPGSSSGNQSVGGGRGYRTSRSGSCPVRTPSSRKLWKQPGGGALRQGAASLPGEAADRRDVQEAPPLDRVTSQRVRLPLSRAGHGVLRASFGLCAVPQRASGKDGRASVPQHVNPGARLPPPGDGLRGPAAPSRLPALQPQSGSSILVLRRASHHHSRPWDRRGPGPTAGDRGRPSPHPVPAASHSAATEISGTS